jgi:tRNA(Ile)-lysidine synthase
MDDQAETVIIALLRGSGMDGTAAMRPGNEHPLLSVRRSETVKLCSMLEVPTFDDPTNSSDLFQRNRVRHHLIPLCCDIAGRDVVPLLARHAQLMAEESQFLDELSMPVDPTDVKSIRSAGRVLARRAIRRWLRSGNHGYPPDQAGVERVLAVANGLFKGTDVVPGIHISRSKGILAKSYVSSQQANSDGTDVDGIQ